MPICMAGAYVYGRSLYVWLEPMYGRSLYVWQKLMYGKSLYALQEPMYGRRHNPMYDRSLCMAGAYVWQEAGAYIYGRSIYMAVAYRRSWLLSVGAYSISQQENRRVTASRRLINDFSEWAWLNCIDFLIST